MLNLGFVSLKLVKELLLALLPFLDLGDAFFPDGCDEFVLSYQEICDSLLVRLISVG